MINREPKLESDQELIASMRAGASEALAEFYDRHAASAYGLALKMLRQPQTAEEVVQDAFTSVWRSSARYRPETAAPRTWLLSIVRNRAIDRIRSAGSRPASVQLDDAWMQAAPSDTAHDVLRVLDATAVRDAVRRLPDTQRRTIELAYFGGHTFTEIAELTAVPVGTVKSRTRLALERLRADAALEVRVRPDAAPSGRTPSRGREELAAVAV